MTVDEFINYVEAVYGVYPGGKDSPLKMLIERYFEYEHYFPSELDKLAFWIVRYYSTTSGKTPDIAIFEKVDKEYRIRQWGPGGDRIIPAEDRRVMIEERIPESEGIPVDWKAIVKGLVKKNNERMKQVREEKE